MQVQVIQALHELHALKCDWQALSASVPQSTDFFSGWEFTWQYVNVIKPGKWFVVTFRDAGTGRLTAVFPWELFTLKTDEGDFRVVEPLGPGLVPYMEYPVLSQHLRPVLKILLNEVMQLQVKADLLCLWPLHQASLLYQVLTEDMSRSGMLKTFRYPGNLREIETRGGDYESYSRSKSSATFASARYSERRLSKEGVVQITLKEETTEAVQVAKWICEGSKRQFGDEFLYRHQPRWADLVTALSESGAANVSTLRLNGQVIAGALSYWHKGRRYYYLCHYDSNYAQHSPGKILMHRLIEQTFQDKGVFCFGAGAYHYKEEWSQSTGELKAAYLFLSSPAQRVLDKIIDAKFIDRIGMI